MSPHRTPPTPAARCVERAQAAQANGDLFTAVAEMTNACQLAPGQVDMWNGLAELLHNLGRDKEALAALERAFTLVPLEPTALLFAGLVHNALGDTPTAEACLRQLVKLAPFHSSAQANLASLLEHANRRDEAEREAREALRIAPHMPLANLVVAQCAFHRRDYDACEMFLGRIRLPRGKVPQHAAYLTARLLDARGRFDAAYAAFAEANRLSDLTAAQLRLDAAAYRANLADETSRYTPEWVASWAPLPPPPPLPFRLAFLVGFPRSGTTLLEQMLDAHPGVAALEERPFFEDGLNGLRDWQKVGWPDGLASLDGPSRDAMRAGYATRVLAEIPAVAGHVVVDKFPLKLTKAGAIHRLFPEARFVFALRHPYDVVLSCFMQEFSLNDAMANLTTLEGAAALYDLAMTSWLRARERFPLDVVTVRYERVIDDLAAEVRPALAHLGLDWDARVAEFAAHARSRGTIRTPSYSQVSQGLYTSARGRWQRYEQHFTPAVRALLDPWVERWGY